MRPTRLVLAALLVVLLAGCTDPPADTTGSDDTLPTNNEGPADNQTTQEMVTLDVGWSGAYPTTIAYDPDRLEAPAEARVTVRFTNNDLNPLAPHDWVLEGHEGVASTEVIDNGETSEVTFDAPPPGEYVFYCSVPGHRGNGMEGTFVVT